MLIRLVQFFLFLLCFTSLIACSGGSSDALRDVDFTNGAVLEGEINGAPYKIAVPPAAEWNGTLIIYLPGYRDRANSEMDLEDRSVSAAPGGVPLEQALLAQGFAIAGTAYQSNGWAVEFGLEDVNFLRAQFVNAIGEPEYTILNGFSMGSVVALASLERQPDFYDGALAACNVGGGTSRNFRTALDFLLAYDVAFGGIPASHL